MMIVAKKMCDVHKQAEELLSSELEMKSLNATRNILGLEIFKDMKEKKFVTEDLQ